MNTSRVLLTGQHFCSESHPCFTNWWAHCFEPHPSFATWWALWFEPHPSFANWSALWFEPHPYFANWPALWFEPHPCFANWSVLCFESHPCLDTYLLMRAPNLRRSCTTLTCPFAAAAWSGVCPTLSVSFTVLVPDVHSNNLRHELYLPCLSEKYWMKDVQVKHDQK